MSIRPETAFRVGAYFAWKDFAAGCEIQEEKRMGQNRFGRKITAALLCAALFFFGT